jgi:hypothetical protein
MDSARQSGNMPLKATLVSPLPETNLFRRGLEILKENAMNWLTSKMRGKLNSPNERSHAIFVLLLKLCERK